MVPDGELRAAAAAVRDWDAVVSMATRHGVDALVTDAVARAAVELPASAAQTLQRIGLIGLATVLGIDAELNRLIPALGANGVPTIVLKGPALARTIYARRVFRPYGDIDLTIQERHHEIALEDLARVKAGAPAAVVSARSGGERAEADLARANVGPSDDALKAADQQIWGALLAQQRAEANFERLKQGPDPNALRAAEREVAVAQGAVVRARLDFERMASGDPQVVSAAQQEVQRAELALRTAQATRIDSGGSKSAQQSAKVARESAIANARLSLNETRRTRRRTT